MPHTHTYTGLKVLLRVEISDPQFCWPRNLWRIHCSSSRLSLLFTACCYNCYQWLFSACLERDGEKKKLVVAGWSPGHPATTWSEVSMPFGDITHGWKLHFWGLQPSEQKSKGRSRKVCSSKLWTWMWNCGFSERLHAASCFSSFHLVFNNEHRFLI